MQQIQATATIRVPEANREQVRAIFTELFELVGEREPDTLQFMLYVSEDGSRYKLREIYRDSAAYLHHLQNCAEPLSRLLPLVQVSLDACGNPTQELLAELGNAAPTFTPFAEGVDRLVDG